MITLSEVLAGMLAGSSFQVHSRLTSWWDGEPISEDIPAVDVSETADATLRVPERLTFKVPVVDDRGLSWVPTRYDSPLGTYGQRIVAQVGVSVVGGNVEWLNRGTFLIESADKEGDAISVECLGLKQLLDEARYPNEYQPKAGATLGSLTWMRHRPTVSLPVRSLSQTTGWTTCTVCSTRGRRTGRSPPKVISR